MTWANVKKSEAETSVLFELIAHRYEAQKSVGYRQSTLQPVEYDFFADDMMTVAAVDRLVHHALIVELQAESYRKRSADQRAQTQDVAQNDSR